MKSAMAISNGKPHRDRVGNATAAGVLLPAMLLLCFAMAGCEGGGPPLVAVEGTLTAGGQAWPKPGMLYFACIEPAEGQPSIPGSAAVNADGTFTAECSLGTGLVPGTYKVSFECWEKPPGSEMDPPPVSYVAEAYQRPHSSPVEIQVELGKPVKLDHDVPLRGELKPIQIGFSDRSCRA